MVIETMIETCSQVLRDSLGGRPSWGCVRDGGTRGILKNKQKMEVVQVGECILSSTWVMLLKGESTWGVRSMLVWQGVLREKIQAGLNVKPRLQWQASWD